MQEYTFTVYWLGDEKPEIIKGINIEHAFQLAGYGSGTLKVLDIYTHGDTRDKYYYDNGKWKLK